MNERLLITVEVLNLSTIVTSGIGLLQRRHTVCHWQSSSRHIRRSYRSILEEVISLLITSWQVSVQSAVNCNVVKICWLVRERLQVVYLSLDVMILI